MKKYKLIKEYPGSPKINTIVDHNYSNRMYNFCVADTENSEKWKEYWEEVKEKEYEILSFINKNDQIFEKTWQSPLYHHFYITFGFLLEEILTGNDNLNRITDKDLRSYQYQVKLEEFKIYSVKRLSDGEIFTIGDKYRNTAGTFTISNFDITDTELRVYAKEFGYGILSELKKVKQPLFKTEDGVSMYTGNTVWYTNINYRNLKNCIWSSIVEETEPFTPIKGLFSTKEAAEEYVVLNKPVLSIKDVLDNVPNNVVYDYIKPKLEELVKQKLK